MAWVNSSHKVSATDKSTSWQPSTTPSIILHSKHLQKMQRSVIYAKLFVAAKNSCFEMPKIIHKKMCTECFCSLPICDKDSDAEAFLHRLADTIFHFKQSICTYANVKSTLHNCSVCALCGCN